MQWKKVADAGGRAFCKDGYALNIILLFDQT
jgi:hypothetical protein